MNAAYDYNSYKESTDKTCRVCGRDGAAADRTLAWRGWTYVGEAANKRWICTECQLHKQSDRAYPENELEVWDERRRWRTAEDND